MVAPTKGDPPLEADATMAAMRPFLPRALRLAGLLALLVTALITGAAQAQPPAAPGQSKAGAKDGKDARARADAHADKGRRYYDLRRYDQAIKEFEAAYELDADPAHLYNIAQAHRVASHIPQAIEAYQSYLNRFPNAPNRADVERRIAELKESGRPPNTLEPQPGGAAAAAPAPYPGWPPPQAQAPPPAPGYTGYATPAYGAAPAYPPQGYAPPPGYPATPLVGDPGAPAGYGAGSGYGAPAPYPPPPPPPTPALAATGLPGDRTHDGLFLRAQLGAGVFNMTVDEQDISFRGPAGSFAVAAGVAISDRLVLYGELASGATADPDIEVNGVSRNLDGSVTVTAIGAGAAFYIMPVNAYVSATVSGTQVTFELDNEKFESEIGAGLTLSAGKEWWLARNLGVGAALQLHASSAKTNDTASASTLQPLWVTIALSATFN
jgi:hypothetical protein